MSAGFWPQSKINDFNTFYILDTDNQVLWKTVKTPDEMPHKAAFYQGMHCMLS